jgi:hypothetical protein
MSLNQKITKSLLKIPATQLTEVEVKAISLVPHGANQSPFKVLKSEDIDPQQMEEDNMINFGEFFTRSKSDDKPTIPTVATITIKADGDNVEELKEAIKAEGFSVDMTEERDGALILKQDEDVNVDKLTYFKSNDDIIIGIANVEKSFDPWSSTTSFSENLQKNSFLPGLALATNVMQETAFEILVSADKSEDFKELLEKSAADFSAHVISLASNIPASAFKLEAIKIEAKEEEKKLEDTPVEKSQGEDEGQEEAKKEDEVQTEAASNDSDNEGASDDVDFSGLMDTATERMTKTMEAMQASFMEANSKLTETVKSIADRLETLETETKQNAKKAEEDLNNVVMGSSINTDMGSRSEDIVKTWKTNEKAEYPEELWGSTLNSH